MTKCNHLLFLFLLLPIIACQVQITPLESALSKAGENRAELEKVLVRYRVNPSDSLKYKAVCYLIENLPYHSYYEGELLDKYLDYYKILGSGSNMSPNAIIDSLRTMYGTFSVQKLKKKYDIFEVDSAFLCDNIDFSFKLWREQPWGKTVSFEDFCEYILPYRIGNEPLSRWKQKYHEQYMPLLNVIVKQDIKKMRSIDAVRVLMDSISRCYTRFTSIAPPHMPHIGPEAALHKSGSCRDLSDFIVYMSRSLGIPCTTDNLILRGMENNNHFWIVYPDKSGDIYIQDLLNKPSRLRGNGFRGMDKLKVYRTQYSVNRDFFQDDSPIDDPTAYPFFVNPKLLDVTPYYSDCLTEELFIPKSKLYKGKIPKRVYLCLINRMNWEPIACGKGSSKGVAFKNIHKGHVVRVASWENENLKFHSPPFIIEYPLGNLRMLSAESDRKESVTLYTKTNLKNDRMFVDRIVGGVFEGSNDPDFITRDTLYRICSKPFRLLNYVTVNNSKEYRYLRYRGSSESFCNISEVAFFGSMANTIPLKGEIIGTPGDYGGKGTKEFYNVFDGKTTTSFDYKEIDGGWAGLHLDKPCHVEKIMFAPRNTDNYIRPQNEYELFVLKEDWKSLAYIQSTSDSLKFTNLPHNSLFYLRNHSGGVEERIFTVEDGEPQWR